MNLVLLSWDEFDADGVAVLRGARARHIARVLGAKPGGTIRAGMLDGPAGSGEVLSVSESEVRLRCKLEQAIPPVPRVDLLLALPRPKVMKRLWAQLAALGAGKIIIANAARVERNYFDTHVLDETFFRPLLVEGLQQARDTRLPRVSVHRGFRRLVEDELDALSNAAARIVADPSGEKKIGAVAGAAAADGRVLLAVGPEGGWVPFELELLEKHGFVRAGIGPRILRADTACVALLALVHAALETSHA